MLASREGRRASMLVLACMAIASSAVAADITVTNQSEFDDAVATATQSGHADTIHVDAEAINSGPISSGPALMLPGAADSIVIEFNGIASGPTVYNPVFDVGFGQAGELGIGTGTTLNFHTDNGIASLRVGFSDGVSDGSGTVNMTGGTINGDHTAANLYFSLNVGRGSPDSVGAFNQSGGFVQMNGGALNIGVDSGTGTYTLSNDATLDAGAGTVYLGAAGGNGTLYIHDDAQFLVNAAPATDGQVFIGDGATGTVIQDGAGSSVVLNAQNGTWLGLGGGTGTYLLSAGALEFGGIASGNSGLNLGGDATSRGTFTQTGGTLTLNSGQIRFGAGTGTYNLEGGTLAINVANPFFVNSAGTHAFNLGGGTIQALTNFSTAIDFNLVSGLSVVDTFDGTAGHTVTLSGTLQGAGGLEKAGDGTLILNGINTYTGGTVISGGILQLGPSGSLASTGALEVAAGATLDLNNHTQQVGSLSGGGTVDVGTGLFAAGSNNASTAFSGTVDGTFVKVGAGTLRIDDATFTGETYVTQGALEQTGGTASVGYLALGEGLSGSTPNVGALGISGGLLTVGSALQVGDFGGEGIVNQTGGTVEIGDSLNIGNQGGTGTYNISGGALELNALLNTLGRSAGTNPGSTGTLNISGTGVVELSNNGITPTRLIIGYGNSDPAQAQAEGVINQTGGTLRIHNGSTLNLAGQNTSTGVYNLYGGTLEIGGDSLQSGYLNPAPNYAFNIGGGTIRVIESALDTDVDATLVAGVSTIDTNGFGATFNGGLSGTGALVKAGAGTLVLNAANTYAGGTEIAAGTLQLGPGGSLASTGMLVVDALGTFDLNGRTQTVGDFVGAGTVLLGTGALTAGTANDTLFSGSIAGPGSFVKQGTGTLSLTGNSTYAGGTTVAEGRLIVDGSLVSDVVVNGGATLDGNGSVGSVDLAGGATVAPGNSIGTLSTVGIAFAPGSAYQVEINAAGQSDRIVASGGATINGGTVNVLAQAGNYVPGTTYTILSAAGGVAGIFSGATSNLLFLDSTLSYDPMNVFLTLTRNSITFSSIAATPNQRAVANALEQSPATNPLYIGVLGQTEGGARQAFDALSGEVHATVSGVLVQNSRFVRDAIFGRLTQAAYARSGGQDVAFAAGGPTTVAMSDTSGRMTLGMGNGAGDDGFNALRAYSRGLAFWTQGFGSWGEVDGDGNAASARRNLGGFLSGADAAIGDGWRAGLATGYMRTDLSVDARASSAEVDSYMLAAYAGGGYGPLALRSGASWTWHWVDSSRTVVFPGFSETESADYNANTGQIFAEVALPILAQRSAVEPFAGIGYVHVDTGGFTESGSVAALSTSGNDQDVGYTTLGVRAATTTALAGYAVTPHASMAWQYAFGDLAPVQTFAFASTDVAFGISGAPVARNSALIEAGLDVTLAPDATFNLSYFGQLGDDISDNGVQGRLNWRY